MTGIVASGAIFGRLLEVYKRGVKTARARVLRGTGYNSKSVSETARARVLSFEGTLLLKTVTPLALH